MENKNLILFIFVISSLAFAQSPEEKISSHLNYWILVCYCLIMFIIAGIVALIIILSGVKLFTNEDMYEREEAKKRIKYAIVVLIFILIACPLVNFLIEGGDVKEFKCNCPPPPKSTTTTILWTTALTWSTTTTSYATTSTPISTSSTIVTSTPPLSSTTTIFTTHCVTILNNGDPSNKLDIVFVGDDYDSSELGIFISKVQEHMNALLNTAPYSSYRNKINVHYVNKFEDLECHLAYDRSILCNSAKVITLASECPHDNIVVLFKSNEWAGAGGESMSSSPYCVSSHAYPWLSIHECGGHHIGLLMDEYDYGEMGSLYYSGANCDTEPSCSKWVGTPGTGCYPICSYRNLYRATENNCLMRTRSIWHFCPVCQRQIISILNNYN
ncbi:MAG: M64 family metallopeptidase [Candidatus Altiarchaeota archaeon]